MKIHTKKPVCLIIILLIAFGTAAVSRAAEISPPFFRKPLISNPTPDKPTQDQQEKENTDKQDTEESSTTTKDTVHVGADTFDFSSVTVAKTFSNDISVINDKINVSVINYPVHDLLNTAFKLLGQKILISSRIREQLSIQLTQVTPEELLDYIATVVNVNWSKKNDVFFVSTEDKLTSASFFPVKNMNLIDLKNTLNTFGLSNRVVFNPYPRGIIVNADPATIKKIGDVIAALDQPIPSIRVEFQVLEINKDEEEKLGIAWQDVIGTYQYSRQYGSANATDALGKATGISKGITTGIVGTAQKMKSIGKILAKPYVITTNNLEAYLSTGDEIPIFSKDYNGNPTVEYKKVGIELYATPSVLDGDILNIKAKTIVNVVSGQETQQGLTVPKISSREAQTTMNIKSGETIVIGGLLKEEDIHNETVVPILNKLPLVGRLFKTSTRSKGTTEIVVFITPTLLSKEEIPNIEAEKPW